MAKYNFCTLFDSGFLLQGLALYKSLEKTGVDFHLYILIFDDEAVEALQKLKLEKATIITAPEFETKELLDIKKVRTKREYFWTCTPSLVLHVLNHFNPPSCTYLDADLFFFESPKVLFEEAENDSIIIVPHRYGKDNDKSEKIGRYCVEFNMFKNNTEGLRTLNWWEDRCIEWCYAKTEDGKFGDQKYLDDWLVRFSGVHELKHLGGGAAPWNAAQYEFFTKNKKVWGKEKATDAEFALIFYHFHHTEIYNFLGKIRVKSYRSIDRNKNLKSLVYLPYSKALEEAAQEIMSANKNYKIKFGNTIKFIWKTAVDLAGQLLRGGQ